MLLNKHKNFFILLFLLIFSLSFLGCDILSPNLRISEPISNDLEEKLKKIHTLLIRNFVGTNAKVYKKLLENTLKRQNTYKIVEILPERLKGVALLNLEVSDFSSWELEEVVNKEDKEEILVRRNAIVTIQYTLTLAQGNQELATKKISQPFQQIYVGKEKVQNRPSIEQEMRRLGQIATAKIGRDLTLNNKKRTVFLESGRSHSWFKDFELLGYRRLRKGNQFALHGDYEQAFSVWSLILYEPEKEETEAFYLTNKASAYYNIGQIQSLQKKYGEAALNFSRANRLIQKVKYAQAWAENILNWKTVILEQQKNLQEPPKLDDDFQLLQSPKTSIENIDQLLLKREKLFLLDDFEILDEVQKGINSSEEALIPKETEIKENSPEEEIEPLDLQPLDLSN